MAKRDILSDLVNIVHPYPQHPGDDADENALDAYDAMAGDVGAAQQRLRERLDVNWEHGDVDPLLGELADTRREIQDAEQRLRLLLAYGREFVEPRPYKLDDLARAAGMSISGVRTAYDDGEIVDVARRIGAKLRRRGDDVEPVTGEPAVVGEPS